MEHTAVLLDTKVLPKVAYRQWTQSLPWDIRWQDGTDHPWDPYKARYGFQLAFFRSRFRVSTWGSDTSS
jgi:hypothetical protein